MKPGPFGHEHMADRAQAMCGTTILTGPSAPCESPRCGSVRRYTGAHFPRGAREFFVLNEWTDGVSYSCGPYTVGKGWSLRKLDRQRTVTLARYLAKIHAKKRRDADLYKRRLRE